MTTDRPAQVLMCLGLLALSSGTLGGLARAEELPALPHFEFAAPAGGNWVADRSTNAMGGIQYFLKQGKAGYQITLFENVALDTKLRQAPAAVVADDYRASERSGMQELGVQPGLYKVSELTMGQETIGGKLYYTMSYVTSAPDHYQRARLYLHFPYPEGNEYFLVAHYAEIAPRRADLAATHEPDFRQLLGTVALRQGEPTKAAAAVTGAPTSVTIAEDFARVHAMTQSPLPRDSMKVRCQAKVGESYVSLIEAPETGVAWVAFTTRKFSDPGKNLLTRMYAPGERGGATMDWGYIVDRNRDGRVDYLAFLIGTGCIAPEKCEEPLPNLTGSVTPRQLTDVIFPNTRLVFWHAADDNGDGNADMAAVPLATVANGWIEGWMVTRDADFDRTFEACRHYAGPLRSDLGPCEGTPASYYLTGRETMGLRRVPPGDLPIFGLIRQAVEDCGLAAEALFDGSP